MSPDVLASDAARTDQRRDSRPAAPSSDTSLSGHMISPQDSEELHDLILVTDAAWIGTSGATAGGTDSSAGRAGRAAHLTDFL